MKPKDYEAKFPLSRPCRRPNHKTSLKFQMWILTYLGIEEVKWLNYYRDVKEFITPWQISQIVPNFILPDIDNVDDIYYTLVELAEAGYLEVSSRAPANEPADTGFSITVNGVLYFRKHLQPLVTAIEKEDYEINMDKIEGNSGIKQELKTLKTKLKGKMEDEIIDGFIGVAKQYGPPAISFIVNLLFKNNPTST